MPETEKDESLESSPDKDNPDKSKRQVKHFFLFVVPGIVIFFVLTAIFVSALSSPSDGLAGPFIAMGIMLLVAIATSISVVGARAYYGRKHLNEGWWKSIGTGIFYIIITVGVFWIIGLIYPVFQDWRYDVQKNNYYQVLQSGDREECENLEWGSSRCQAILSDNPIESCKDSAYETCFADLAYLELGENKCLDKSARNFSNSECNATVKSYYKDQALETGNSFFCSVSGPECWLELAVQENDSELCHKVDNPYRGRKERNYTYYYYDVETFPFNELRQKKVLETQRSCLLNTGAIKQSEAQAVSGYSVKDYSQLLEQLFTDLGYDLENIQKEQKKGSVKSSGHVQYQFGMWLDEESSKSKTDGLPVGYHGIEINVFKYPYLAQQDFDHLYIAKIEGEDDPYQTRFTTIDYQSPTLVKEFTDETRRSRFYNLYTLGEESAYDYDDHYALYSFLLDDNLHVIVTSSSNDLDGQDLDMSEINERRNDILYHLGERVRALMVNNTETD